MDITGKNIIVTGGANGIGYRLVLDLLQEGANVCVIDIDQARLADLASQRDRVITVDCDLTHALEVEACIESIFSKWQCIDILVNNAGVLHSSPLVSFSPDGIKKHLLGDWDKIISANLSSVFYITVCVAEKMLLKRTRGVIVNISSISANGNAGQTAYSAAKAGVNALTATWSKELGMFGIRTVGISPGFINTESTHKILRESAIKTITDKVPLRKLGEVHDISSGIISVIKNDFINGKVIEIDGGLTI